MVLRASDATSAIDLREGEGGVPEGGVNHCDVSPVVAVESGESGGSSRRGREGRSSGSRHVSVSASKLENQTFTQTISRILFLGKYVVEYSEMLICLDSTLPDSSNSTRLVSKWAVEG